MKVLRPSTKAPARHPWQASSHLALGDVVQEREGRHLGEVVGMRGCLAEVRWEGTGWLSTLHFSDLERAGRSYLLEA